MFHSSTFEISGEGLAEGCKANQSNPREYATAPWFRWKVLVSANKSWDELTAEHDKSIKGLGPKGEAAKMSTPLHRPRDAVREEAGSSGLTACDRAKLRKSPASEA